MIIDLFQKLVAKFIFKLSITNESWERYRVNKGEKLGSMKKSGSLFSVVSFSCSNEKLKICSLLIALLAISPVWLMPLSTPVISDVVVVMHNDKSVLNAVQAIRENARRLRIVDYGALDYALIIHRVMGHVAWVSHGSEMGILANDEILSWQEFTSRIRTTPSSDIILAYDSAKVNDFVSYEEALGFDGPVDAKLEGLFVAWLLTDSRQTLISAYERVQELNGGMAEADNLYWSATEKAWFGIDAAIFMVSALSTSFAIWRGTLSPQSTMVVFAAAMKFLSVLLGFVVFMSGACSGTLSPLTVASKLISTMGSVVYAIIRCAPWYVQILSSAEAVLMGVAKLVSLIIMIIGMVSLVSNMLNDMADSDSIYGRIFVGM